LRSSSISRCFPHFFFGPSHCVQDSISVVFTRSEKKSFLGQKQKKKKGGQPPHRRPSFWSHFEASGRTLQPVMRLIDRRLPTLPEPQRRAYNPYPFTCNAIVNLFLNPSFSPQSNRTTLQKRPQQGPRHVRAHAHVHILNRLAQHSNARPPTIPRILLSLSTRVVDTAQRRTFSIPPLELSPSNDYTPIRVTPSPLPRRVAGREVRVSRSGWVPVN
jgi:hypothetical protein